MQKNMWSIFPIVNTIPVLDCASDVAKRIMAFALVEQDEK